MNSLKIIISEMMAFLGIILIAVFTALFINAVDDICFVENIQPETPTTSYFINTDHVLSVSFDTLYFNTSIKSRILIP